jgi:hypothetical protein
MPARHEPAPPADAMPCTVHVKRPDGLDVEIMGSAAFVERVLTALGVIQSPAPPT